MLKVEAQGVNEIVADLNGLNAKSLRAAVSAMNKAIVTGRTAMQRAIASDTKLPATQIRDAMPLQRANWEQARAAFGAPLKRIPLIYFRARQTRRGVTYDAGTGRSVIPHAFLARMASGHPGVFTRLEGRYMRRQKPTWTRLRQAIGEKAGPSLGHVFAKYRPTVMAQTQAAFDKAFAHEWERLTKGDEPSPSD